MNARERFLATMAFEPVDRPPLWEFGYWTEALVRWYREGLPRCEGLPENAGRVFGEGLSWDPSLLPFTARDRDVHLELRFDAGIGRVPLNSFVHMSNVSVSRTETERPPVGCAPKYPAAPDTIARYLD